MDLGVDGKTAVVIGGTKGIGKAIAECFADEGANVAICGRNKPDLDFAVSALSGKNVTVRGGVVDIAQKATIDRWAAELKNKFASIDFIVINASALSADWEMAIDTDLKGTINSVAAFLPYLTQSKTASITYISSKAASFGLPNFEAYGAAKAAMTHYMKSLSLKLTPIGIRVNTVSPGDTLFEGGVWDKVRLSDPGLFEATKNGNGLKRFCTPKEIADAVVFLSSPRASYVSGSNLLIDGASIAQVKL